jgi:hypothetical protein
LWAVSANAPALDPVRAIVFAHAADLDYANANANDFEAEGVSAAQRGFPLVSAPRPAPSHVSAHVS